MSIPNTVQHAVVKGSGELSFENCSINDQWQ